MLSKLKLNQLYFKDTSFVNLMTKRIFNVLLVANPYDAFMLEDDGRIDEKIFIEYMNLSLRYPPRFTQVSTEEEAWGQLAYTKFDLVIVMPGTDNSDTFDIARSIKQKFTEIPLIVLTPFSHGITARMEHEDLSIFEYVFCWLGNTDLLVSIIKLIEDKMNLEHDIKEVGVQMILLVEDSIRFYSSVLPNLYKFVLKQSKEFATEALNENQRTLRIRRIFFVLLGGVLCAVLAGAVKGNAAALNAGLFSALYVGFSPLACYALTPEQADENALALGDVLLVVALGAVAVLFVLALPSVYGFAVPKWLANVAFGWTNVLNNGFFR